MTNPPMEAVSLANRDQVANPKMQDIRDELAKSLEVVNLPYLKVKAEDFLGSCVWLTGSFQAPADWVNKIFENSTYFRISLTPANGRYYHDGDKLKVELVSGYGVSKMRAYTGPLDKIITKLTKWVKEQS